jgi:CDP-4-dehydro-6-deoxyglucose reductase
MATTWYNGKIVKITDETPTVKRFYVEIQDLENFDFRAGQFVTMDLPIGEKRLQRWRSYSIASAPEGNLSLEFCIGRLDGGLGTTYLFEEATIGTLLKFKGPDGNFCLPENDQNDVVMICTGTGVAPFRSMLHDVFSKGEKEKKFHLIFGCRYEKDILYKTELEDLAEKFPNFTYDIALSREKVANCHHGYVHDLYLKKYEHQHQNVNFMLCGWSAMIDDAVANLIVKMGCDKAQVKYELYG